MLLEKKFILSLNRRLLVNCIYFFSKKNNNQWMNDHVRDEFVRKAKLLNYRSRAAFKLIEIDQRYDLMKPGYKVIDLGSTPGSWTQVAVEKCNSTQISPTVLGIDLLEMNEVKGAKFIRGDIDDHNIRVKIQEFFKLSTVDVVLSDMSPNRQGDRDADHMEMAVLNRLTLLTCGNSLKIGGTLLMKTLQGSFENQFFNMYKHLFKNFQRVKPSASRSKSSEIYYLGRGYKLNENYYKLKKITELLSQNKSLDAFTDKELKELGFDNQIIREMVKDLVTTSSKFGQPIDQQQFELLNKQFKLGLSYESLQTDPINFDLSQEKLYELVCERFQGKLSFTKKIPKSIDELENLSDERYKKQQLKEAKQSKNDDELLQSDDEYIPFSVQDDSESSSDLDEQIVLNLVKEISDEHIDIKEDDDSTEDFLQQMKQGKIQLNQDILNQINKMKDRPEFEIEHELMSEYGFNAEDIQAMEDQNNFDEFKQGEDKEMFLFDQKLKKRAEKKFQQMEQENPEIQTYLKNKELDDNFQKIWKK